MIKINQDHLKKVQDHLKKVRGEVFTPHELVDEMPECSKKWWLLINNKNLKVKLNVKEN